MLNVHLEVMTIPPHRKINNAPEGTIEIEHLNRQKRQKNKIRK